MERPIPHDLEIDTEEEREKRATADRICLEFDIGVIRMWSQYLKEKDS